MAEVSVAKAMVSTSGCGTTERNDEDRLGRISMNISSELPVRNGAFVTSGCAATVCLFVTSELLHCRH